MIIDVHVHICPPEVRDNREAYLPDEPEFAAIYKNPKAKLVGATELIQTMDEQGVDKAVVFGFPWRKEDNFRLNNDYVLEAAQRFPDRLIPLACFDATHPKGQQETERCLHSGARGIGELAFYSAGIDEQAREAIIPLAQLCAEAGAIVSLHTNEPIGHNYPGKSPMTLSQLYSLLQATPDTRWILAHLGGGLPFYAFLKKEVREVLANVWFDTAAMPFLYRPQALGAMADAVGLDKLLLGTDFPLLPPTRYFREFENSGLDLDELEAVLGLNAAKLWQVKL
ncbi:MAG: amidohydrolase family protein [Desulfovermiculus sp.]|nr:amidohydrolase family protein [Desulfovermiculus sp.]